MVRAILEGRKTQTRRIFNDSVSADCVAFHFYEASAQWRQMFSADKLGNLYPKQWGHHCPYGIPGDRLWVKETFHHGDAWYPDEPGLSWKNCRRDGKCTWVDYRATWTATQESERDFPWKPSIHMPRWASRITLEVEQIRVERLHEIGKDGRKAHDVLAEGITHAQIDVWSKWLHPDDAPAHTYGVLWESINGKGSWALNPWVWVVTFRPLAFGAAI